MKKRKNKIADLVINIVCILLSLTCILPLILVLSVSFSSESSIVEHGYKFLPTEISLDAYKYLWSMKDSIISAYGVTILATVIGTLVSVFVIALYAYALSRPNLLGKKFFTFYIFFTMLFSGGLVSWYMICTRLLHIQNTIWALILPYVMNAWYVIIMRTFFNTSVPEALIESARIDGASEFVTLFKIVMPISLPGIFTIALFQTLTYWNDWWLAINLITEPKLYNLQMYLQNLLANIENLKLNADLNTGMLSGMEELPSEGARMALCIVAMGPILVVYPFFQKYFIQGLTVGAVKG